MHLDYLNKINKNVRTFKKIITMFHIQIYLHRYIIIYICIYDISDTYKIYLVYHFVMT